MRKIIFCRSTGGSIFYPPWTILDKFNPAGKNQEYKDIKKEKLSPEGDSFDQFFEKICRRILKRNIAHYTDCAYNYLFVRINLNLVYSFVEKGKAFFPEIIKLRRIKRIKLFFNCMVCL